MSQGHSVSVNEYWKPSWSLLDYNERFFYYFLVKWISIIIIIIIIIIKDELVLL